ncbi:MAG: signal peptide peptidase SppA [Nitrospirota bacterium]
MSLLNDRPLLISGTFLNQLEILSDIHSQHEIEGSEGIAALSRTLKSQQDKTSGHDIVNGTAIIGISGFLSQRMDIFTLLFGGTAIETVADNFKAALDDPAVKSILLNIDSPGGAVDGTSGLSDLIYQSRGRKPIIAVANSIALSAAYWIASAADRVYVSSTTSQAGSIGVVARHTDLSGAEAMAGVKTTEIVAGKYKRITSQYEPLSTDGKQTLQGMVDYIYGLFVSSVARNRGISSDGVLKNMADGRIFIGQQAVNSGLVDGIRSLDQILAEPISISKPTPPALVGVATTKGETPMTTESPKPSTTAPVDATSKHELPADYMVRLAEREAAIARGENPEPLSFGQTETAAEAKAELPADYMIKLAEKAAALIGGNQ